MYQNSQKNVMRKTIYINCSKNFSLIFPQCVAILYIILHEISQLKIPNVWLITNYFWIKPLFWLIRPYYDLDRAAVL